MSEDKCPQCGADERPGDYFKDIGLWNAYLCGTQNRASGLVESVDCLRRQLAAAVARAERADAACEAMSVAISDFLKFENSPEGETDQRGHEAEWLEQTERLAAAIQPNPGRPLLDELERKTTALRDIAVRTYDPAAAKRAEAALAAARAALEADNDQ